MADAHSNGKRGCRQRVEYDEDELAGAIYGYLTLVRRFSQIYGNNKPRRRLAWECRCVCGETVIRRQEELLSGRTYSCGCSNKKRPTIPEHKLRGKTFGLLTLVERNSEFRGAKRRRLVWVCRCLCGTVVKRAESDVLNGQSHSCGCQNANKRRRSRHANWKGSGELPGQYLAQVRSHCRAKCREYSVTPDYLWNLFLSQKKQCALSGLPIGFATLNEQRNQGLEQTASLDRIDSTEGYIPGNVWWVHKDINKMKWNQPLERFIELCRLVAVKAEANFSALS